MDRENPSRYSEIAINFVLMCACSFEQLSSAPDQCVANTGKQAGMERVNKQKCEIATLCCNGLNHCTILSVKMGCEGEP